MGTIQLTPDLTKDEKGRCIMEWLSEMTAVDWLGVLGSFFIAGAYFGVSNGMLNGEGSRFQWLNLIGAIMILASLYQRPNAGAIMIEVLWMIIAINALLKNWRRGRRLF